jgi:hypothetical protein
LSFALFAGCAGGEFPPDPPQPPVVPPASGFPCIRSVSPSRGLVGSDITLTGEFGDRQMPIMFSSGDFSTQAIVRSWSPSQVVVSAPDISWGRWSVTLPPGGCILSPEPSFQAIPPARVYINNNANDADGFNTVTAMAFDLETGALTPMGKPRSIGIPASRRAGCNSLELNRRLYASGDTGVAALDIDPATGALLPALNGSPFLSGSTGGAAVHHSGAYVWTATDDGVAIWRIAAGAGGSLLGPERISTLSARSMTFFGLRPSKLYTTRGDDTFDAWSVSYPSLGGGQIPLPVLTPVEGSPYGTPGPSQAASGITYATMPDDDMLYVPSTEGLRVWRTSGGASVTEVAGSPFALNPPSGTLGRPVFASSSSRTSTIYMAGIGTGYIVAATLDEAGIPTQVAGSPWNFAPDVTNISCLTRATSASGAVRLIATDAGNRRIAVFDLPAGSTTPVPVPGSPFVMADTPSELASGIAILQPPPDGANGSVQ